MKRELRALHIALSEDLAPWYAKLLILITLGYALSPIDLIPDFIPVLGILDDLIILPVLIYLSIKMIPDDILEYCRREAEIRPWNRKKNWIAGGIVLLIWALIVVWIVYQFFPSVLQ
ncbi:YkvA family protein [Salinimicrobium gaetbulicola]|uniref:YkvA family protein n=1 Tax=Salinimicrobium gaetbulicola TaxID=999702 RepID=A0ABW3IF63_9FLAO